MFLTNILPKNFIFIIKFDKYLTGKNKLLDCTRAIKSFLFTILDYHVSGINFYYDKLEVNPYDKSYQKLIHEPIKESNSWLPIKSDNFIDRIPVDPSIIIKKLISIGRRGLKTLVFIDIGDMIENITHISFHEDSSIHIILFIPEKTIIPLAVQSVITKPWFSIIKAISTLDVISASLNMTISQFVTFILISQDKFIIKLQTSLQLLMPERRIVCGTIEDLLNI